MTMPPREHTDPRALDAMWSRSVIEPIRRPGLRWYRVVWLWIKEELFKAPIEDRTEDDAIQRRIHVYGYATGGARRLRKLPRDEAAEILVVTAELLGLGAWRVAPQRQRAPR